MTCTCSLLPKLKKEYGGKFLIPATIKREVIDKPLTIPRFKFEGYRLKKLLEEGILDVVHEGDYKEEIKAIEELANSTFSADGKELSIIQEGEIALLAMAKLMKVDAVAVDERTTRLLIESPDQIPALIGAKLHTQIYTNPEKLKQLREKLSGINLLRSVDLCTIAYLKGFLDQNKEVLDGLLWALKFSGCAVSQKEIEEYSKKFI